MRIHRHAVTLAAALALAAVAPPLYAQTTRIAVVDLQRAIGETEDGRRAQKRLKRMMSERQEELNEATEKLKLAKKQLDAAWPTLTDEAKQRRQQELQEDYVELQSKYAEYQRELANAEARATRDILERMQEILRRLGQREGYTLILEKNEGGVVWAPSNMDLTDRVIQAYERQHGGDD